jgi:sulfatase maturation enzyme AslB (radical SAM superfamily)
MEFLKYKPCLFPWTHMFYHNDKKVYPCCKVAGNSKFALGSTNDSIESLWNSEIMRNLRLDIINHTEPEECYFHCFKNINPLHLYLPDQYREKQQQYFQETDAEGFHHNYSNFAIWNINESNVCNFACVYCNKDFSNQFKEATSRKSFESMDQMLALFKEQASNIEILFLSSGESHLQPGYYKMLNILLEQNLLDIEINVHTNMSGYMYGQQNFFELLSKFNNVTVFGSLDSYGERAEYIRKGTCWKAIENTRSVLQSYPNIKFVIQAVITNLNLWSLPDFHEDWVSRGLVTKENIRYFCLTAPEHFHISVLENQMKEKIKEKYVKYLEFLANATSTKYNTMTPYDKVQQILQHMMKSPKIPLSVLNFNLLKMDLQSKLKFKTTFPEFQI